MKAAAKNGSSRKTGVVAKAKPAAESANRPHVISESNSCLIILAVEHFRESLRARSHLGELNDDSRFVIRAIEAECAEAERDLIKLLEDLGRGPEIQFALPCGTNVCILKQGTDSKGETLRRADRILIIPPDRQCTLAQLWYPPRQS
jgi:hypothetical protein